jgi:hypothetical protein
MKMVTFIHCRKRRGGEERLGVGNQAWRPTMTSIGGSDGG